MQTLGAAQGLCQLDCIKQLVRQGAGAMEVSLVLLLGAAGERLAVAGLQQAACRAAGQAARTSCALLFGA